ncbi:unnamed protein product [Trichogramma brassicae]|uniref:Uncharacterized protein n=1 Tax=Trichogramma brassicae TaxID=86971 RepID=A0A6H5J7W6_9HYME|nr:unnamed protein product [Trichogramma brassicae]
MSALEEHGFKNQNAKIRHKCDYCDYSSDSSDTIDYESDESDAEGDDPATCRENLEKLKSLLQDKQIDRQVKEERREFHRQLHRLVRRWKKLLPDLRDIFRPEEIDWLLSEDMHRGRHAFIDFAIRTGYKDEPEVDENGKPSSTRLTTAVHHAARDWDGEAILKLFKIYSRFDVNYRDESGFSHFHAACAYGCDDVVEKFLESGQDPNCLPRESGDESSVDPPLFLAIARDHKRTMELLLRGGADPKLADKNGWTPLHMICGRKYDDGMAELFFEINDEKRQRVDVDAQSQWGDRPLQLALENKRENVTELLLRRGAEPSLVKRNGSNCVHLICVQGPDGEVATFLKTFFEIVEKIGRSVEVDSRDELGRTPLQRAVERDHKKVVEVLLRNGADPNSADDEGLTFLHSICTKGNDDRLAKSLFEIGKEKNLFTVQVDARDKKGRTPLQWAVANFLPDVVDVLLNHGADISSYVYPSEEHFDECKWLRTNLSKLKLVLHNLAVIEHLEKRGYEPLRRDALAIMRIFLEDASHETSVSLDHLRGSEKFVSKARELWVNSSLELSLYDFVRLRHAEKLLPTVADFLSFVNSNGLSRLPGRYGDACERYLADKMEREFFRRWTLDSFLELVHKRLPIECCDMILDLMENEDLMRVCQAAEL